MAEVNIQLTEFSPDLQDNANLKQAENVLFSHEGIVPHNNFKRQGSGAFDRDIKQIVTVLGQTYLLGAKKLYRLSDTFTPTDVTKTGVDYATDNTFIDSLEFNSDFLFTDGVKNIQKIDTTNTSAKTEDLVAIKAKTMAVVKQFVFIGNITDSSGVQPYTVRWSGINDATNFTASASTQSGSQNLIEGGDIQRIVGGRHGIIFLNEAIYRADYTGGALIFSFNKIDDRGTTIPEAVVKSGDRIYFISRDGFRVTQGGESQNIGNGRINKWFYATWDGTSLIHGVKLQNTDLIYWSFTNKDGNKQILVFNEVLNKFSTLKFNHDAVGLFKIPVQSIDSVTSSIDDYVGSFDTTTTYSPELCVIQEGHLKVVDGGRYLTTTIQSGFIDLGLIRNVNRINPDNNKSADIQGRVHTKLYSDSDVKTGLWVSNHPTTFDINTRASGRKLSVELKFQGDFGLLNNISATINGESKR